MLSFFIDSYGLNNRWSEFKSNNYDSISLSSMHFNDFNNISIISDHRQVNQNSMNMVTDVEQEKHCCIQFTTSTLPRKKKYLKCDII